MKTQINIERILFCLIVCYSFIFTSCKLNTTAPPKTAGDSTIIAQPVSRVFIPITVNADSLMISLKEQIKNPIEKDHTKELSLRLLINEEMSVKKYVEKLTKAAIPGHFETKEQIRDVWEKVKVGTESYKCYFTPWKWGSCWRDVFKDVKREVKEYVKVWVDEIPAQFEVVAIPAIEIKEAIIPTTAVVNYTVNIDNLNITFNGNTFQATSYANYEISVDVNQGVLAFNQQIKGVLKTTGSVVYRVDGEISLGPEGNIGLVNREATLTWSDLGVPLAIEAITYNSATSPYFFVVKELVGNVLQKKVNKLTNKFLDEQNNKFNVKSKLISLIKKANTPIEIQKDLYFTPNIDKAFVVKIDGTSVLNVNILTAKTGVYFSPSIIYSSIKPTISNTPDLVALSTDTSQITSITLNGQLEYGIISKRLQFELNKFIESKNKKYEYRIGRIEMYPSERKLAISVELKKKNKSKGFFYLTAEPEFNIATKKFLLSNVKFVLDSKNALLDMASWLVDSKIEKFIESKAIYDSTNKFEDVTEYIKDVKINSGVLSLVGKFEEPKLSKFYLRDSCLSVYLSAKGTLAASINKFNF